ncbi:hypothetical protein B9Z55_003699 [Caenorhabditis nigoni]|nr:hypothetical protein B9Z55_003699 [Caenorhabditis nigoni]
MPIALLKFPKDLLGDVFEQFHPFELYCISKCSKRIRNSVKLGGTQKWKISYAMSETTVSCEDMNFVFKYSKKPDDYFTRRTNRYGIETEMYTEYPHVGAIDLFGYLLETFGIRIIKCLWTDTKEWNSFSEIAKHLINSKTEIEKWELYSNGNKDNIVENIMSVINKVNITQGFECFVQFASDFQHQFIRYPKEISLRTSSWFTIDQLLNCTCVQVDLYDSMLSNQDINVFFEKWKKPGTFPNLQLLFISSDRIDEESPILDMSPPIRNVETPIKVIKSIPSYFSDWMFTNLKYSFKVIKEDGTERWLRIIGKSFYFVV